MHSGPRRGRPRRRPRRRRRPAGCRIRHGGARAGDYGIRIAEPLYLSHPSSLEHDTGSHPENARRIPAIEAELDGRGWLGFTRSLAPAAEVEWVERVHAPSHVERIRALSEAGGGMIDFDTVVSGGSYEAALHAAGAVCALAGALLEGSASTGFCATRPPGHHAETAKPMGFCLFNSVAVGARHAIDSLGAERVLVLDWDVHHGNGTNEIFHGTDEVLFVSIHQSPLYPGTGPLSDVGHGAGEGYSFNLPVPPGSGRSSFLGLVEHVVAPAARSFGPGLILISAGFDAHRVDPLASCTLESSDYRDLAAAVRALGDEVGAPVGATLEGGYELDALAASVAATMEGLTSPDSAPASVAPDPVVKRSVQALSRYWA